MCVTGVFLFPVSSACSRSGCPKARSRMLRAGSNASGGTRSPPPPRAPALPPGEFDYCQILNRPR